MTTARWRACLVATVVGLGVLLPGVAGAAARLHIDLRRDAVSLRTTPAPAGGVRYLLDQQVLGVGGGASANLRIPFASLPSGTHRLTAVGAVSGRGLGSELIRSARVAGLGQVVLINAPAAVTKVRRARFAWHATRGVRVICIVDGVQRTRCASPLMLSGVAAGTHLLRLRAVRGVLRSGVAVRWAVAVRPTVRVVAGPKANTTSSAATLTWRSGGGALRTSCSLDAGKAHACSSPLHVRSLGAGSHLVVVRVANIAGAAAARRRWRVLVATGGGGGGGTPPPPTTGPPSVTITDQPPSSTTSSSATIAWKVSGSYSTLACTLDGHAYSPCASPARPSGLGTGSHTFVVRAAGSSGAASDSATWTVVSAPAGTAPAGPAPYAGGDSAGNIPLDTSGKRVVLRWVARHTGRLSTLYVRLKLNGSDNCPGGNSGYGKGDTGVLAASTYRVNADGTPNTSAVLATSSFQPCGNLDVDSAALAQDFDVKSGEEYATVVRNADGAPAANYFSMNFLYEQSGVVGANGRNERSANAADEYYNLDPRELVGYSTNGGSAWALPGGPYGKNGGRTFLPTYVEGFSDGAREGQPYYYSSSASGSMTMTFPRVPSSWTISGLGAYASGGATTLHLLVNGSERASATVSGSGMLRAAITPVTVAAGSTVQVASSGGLTIRRLSADHNWDVLMGLGSSYRYYSSASDPAEPYPIYPLPMYRY